MASLEDRLRPLLATLPPGLWVVGVSGGGDSVALVHLLRRLGYSFVVAHLDHGLRESSKEDALWVEALARRFGIPFYGKRVELRELASKRGANLEALARTVRYNFLFHVAKQVQAQAVLTAHTADDQAETLFLQLLRGTGRALGIRAQQGHLYRPLLGVRRAELRAYLAELGESWKEDPTNEELDRDRNYLRHEVMPRLEKRFPQGVAALARFASARQAEEDLLETQARARLLWDLRWPVPALRVAPLLQASPALRRRALRIALEELKLPVEARWIELVEAALAGLPGWLPPRVRLRRTLGSLFFIDRGIDLPPGLRRPQPEDRLPGGKRLRRFLAEMGVPPELRGAWPVRGEGLLEEVWRLWPPSEEQRWMAQALELARAARTRGEVPVGALAVLEGKVLAQASNRVEEGDPTAHAEMLLLRELRDPAVRARMTLYVTLEPCGMCAAALREAGVRTVVYGVENLKLGARTVLGWPAPEWRGGILEGQCAKVLKGFFADLRAHTERCRSG